jgi:hypothetical protein
MTLNAIWITLSASSHVTVLAEAETASKREISRGNAKGRYR